MATYLLTWNPSKWRWHDLEEVSNNVKKGKLIFDEWSCGNTKKINQGDKFFLMKLGKDPKGQESQKGIIASGIIISTPYPRPHWDEERRRAGDEVLSVKIKYKMLLNPYKEEILDVEALPENMNWFPQSSGTSIDGEIAKQTENIWAAFLGAEVLSPDEINADEAVKIIEGAKKTIQVNAYERNPEARKICIEVYGIKCSICNFDFNDFYGEEVAESYIHVHHLKALSEIRKEYEVDPVKDLRPVCPNCHAILHKRKPTYSIEEVKAFIKSQKANSTNDNSY